MSGIKTTISTNRNIYDSKGNYLPIGNYYFLIKRFENNMAIGDVSCRGEFGEFTFESSKVIKMMSIGQARLARRANLIEEGMPNYTSPMTSPSHAFYNTNNIVQHYEHTQQVVHNTTTFSLPTSIPARVALPTLSVKKQVKREIDSSHKCVVCLENLRNKIKTLTCCHVFHPKCINTWLYENQTCPICREPQPVNMLTLVESDNETTSSAEDEADAAPEHIPRPRLPPPPPPQLETNTMEENRIIRNSISFLSDTQLRNASPRTRLRNAREAVANIRERYSFRRRHTYNLRSRSEI
jgi:hypothetical protein